MSAVSTINRSATVRAHRHGELVDLLVESVVLPQDPVARAAVVCSLVDEMRAAVEWLHGPEAAREEAAGRELASLRDLVAAAEDHHLRMKSPGSMGTAGGRRT